MINSQQINVIKYVKLSPVGPVSFYRSEQQSVFRFNMILLLGLKEAGYVCYDESRSNIG